MTDTISLEFEYQKQHYTGEAIATFVKQEMQYPVFDIFIKDEYRGTIIKTNTGWKSDSRIDGNLVTVIGFLL